MSFLNEYEQEVVNAVKRLEATKAKIKTNKDREHYGIDLARQEMTIKQLIKGCENASV